MRAQTWKAIPGFPLYEAGSLGDVRRIGAVAPLRGCPDGRGYAKITIYDECSRLRSVWVHRLVCAAFHGPQPPGLEVLHGDGEKGNCAENNLRWGTRVDNAADRRAHMAQRGLNYAGLSPNRRVSGASSETRGAKLGRFMGSPKTLHSIRSAYKVGLISKDKALELIQQL